MAKLRDRLEAELGNWTSRLPQAWRDRFDGVALDFAACDPEATLKNNEAIWPQETNAAGPPGAHLFKACRDLAPSDVRVVIFGNDPYTHIAQATGRSFEQGDLSAWADDILVSRRISPSLQSVLCAAAATGPNGTGYALTDVRRAAPGNDQLEWLCHRELARAIHDQAADLAPPREIFAHWALQGVLWLNRTLTYTRWLDDADQDTHRVSHQRLWTPFTARMLRILAEEARERRIVVGTWGSAADALVEQLKAIGEQMGTPASNIRVAGAGHPQQPNYYFRGGNPLELINNAIGSTGTQIKWSASI